MCRKKRGEITLEFMADIGWLALDENVNVDELLLSAEVQGFIVIFA